MQIIQHPKNPSKLFSVPFFEFDKEGMGGWIHTHDGEQYQYSLRFLISPGYLIQLTKFRLPILTHEKACLRVLLRTLRHEFPGYIPPELGCGMGVLRGMTFNVIHQLEKEGLLQREYRNDKFNDDAQLLKFPSKK